MKELSWRQRGRLWLRLGLRLALLLLFLWALVRLGPALVSLTAPFLLAFLVAWALSPAVRWLHETWGLSRRWGALILLLLAFAALGALVWWLAGAAVGQVVALAGNWEGLVASLQSMVTHLGVTFSRAMSLLPQALRQTVESMVDRLFVWLDTALPALLSALMDRAAGLARALPTSAVAAVVFVMASYFITADYPQLRSAAAQLLPPGPRLLCAQVRRAVQVGFGGYLKAQLILSVGVFFILLAGLFLVRQPYFLLLALALAILDFIPILGSGTVMVPWAAVDLLMGDFRHALGLMAVWGLVALFRRLAEPKVLGSQTGLSPLLSLVSIYVGMRAAGVLGMVLGPVLCLVARNLLRSGVLDNLTADARLALRDLSALLAPPGEDEDF